MKSDAIPPVLVVMLKAPRAGFVKTRLAREIGPPAALAIYRRLVEQQMSAIPAGWDIEVHFTPPDAAAEMLRWLGPRPRYVPQFGDDLGSRLIHVVAGAFARGATRVIVIGGDCPGLNEACLHDAWRALESIDVVLGPARDGGYYLVGLRQPAPQIFRGIEWSSPSVLDATLDRVRKSGLSCAMLPPKEDVDDQASWDRLRFMVPPADTPGVGAA